MKELTFEEVQAIALEVLKKLTDLCEKEGFRYVLAYGTLIGAVRHKGFIPWDDDIDILMPRPDYDKLMKHIELHPESLAPYIALSPGKTKNYPHNITRIVDPSTWLDVVNEKDCGLGVFVDIYTQDGLGEDYNQAFNLLVKARKLSSLMFLSARTHFHFGLTKGWKKKILKPLAYLYTHLKGLDYFRNKSRMIYENLDYEGSKYVSCVRWCSYAPPRELYPKEWIETTIKWPFEKYEFNIPANYDKMLRQIYGDYMQLPPEKDRIRHHLYKAYKK